MTTSLPTDRIRIGTRASALALWQAHHVEGLLRARWGAALQIDIVEMSTRGDVDKTSPLHTLGGKGVFVREIEERLAAADVDLAVHSMKDLPSQQPPGLTIASTPRRADPRDALVSAAPGATLATLPAGTRLGTGSLRRGALARRINPAVELVPIRGNVPTRLGKVGDQVDAVLLAAAGLTRLDLAHRITEYLDPETFCPAACQGILALQTRIDDNDTRALLEPLTDGETAVATALERGFLARLGAGCNVPLGCHATLDGAETVRAHAVVVGASARPYFAAEVRGPTARAAELGRALAEELLALGAGEVLDAVPGASGS